MMSYLGIFIALIAMSFLVKGCDVFKPGTVDRIERIAIKDELKLVEDEIEELESDVIKKP